MTNMGSGIWLTYDWQNKITHKKMVYRFVLTNMSYVEFYLGNTSLEKVTSGTAAELDFANAAGQGDGSGAGSRRNVTGKPKRRIYVILLYRILKIYVSVND